MARLVVVIKHASRVALLSVSTLRVHVYMVVRGCASFFLSFSFPLSPPFFSLFPYSPLLFLPPFFPFCFWVDGCDVRYTVRATISIFAQSLLWFSTTRAFDYTTPEHDDRVYRPLFYACTAGSGFVLALFWLCFDHAPRHSASPPHPPR